MYKHPGVYIEHIPSGALAIEAASTSIACFIGPAKRGPVNTPEFIINRGQFAQMFGELDDSTSGIRDYGDVPDYFGFAVNQFFDNGGTQAFIVRVTDGTADRAKGALQDPANGAKGLFFEAKNPGAWGNKLVAKIAAVDAADLELGYTLELGYETVQDDGSLEFSAVESFPGLSMDSNDGAYISTTLAARSELVSCKHEPVGTTPGSAQITAFRGDSVFDFDVNTVKNLLLDMTVNGDSLGVKFETNLTDIRVTHNDGGGDVVETHTLDAAMIDLSSLAAGLKEAVNAHSQIDGFGAYASSDSQLVLVPPATPGNGPFTLTVDGGGARTPLGLDGAGATAVDFPGVGRALFINGDDGGSVKEGDYDAAFLTLRDYRSASIIILPGMTYDKSAGNPGAPTYDKAITHSEFMKNRVVIVDPKDPGLGNEMKTAKDVKDAKLPTSTFSALYYPWLKVNNPHYDADTQANRPITHVIPPSGMAAGMWARIDSSRGVWKAPAGLEASVRGIQGPNVLIGNDIQDQLNEWGVNCIRPIIGPPVIWGARTLATKVKADQRYVPVRRTSAMIGESLYLALQAVVFEPNKHTLWASLRASAGDFMDSLFRAGAFQGEKASEAYYVKCGLGQTMTQADIDAGIVRLVVGYAALKPAEFVVVQLKQIVGQQA